MKKLNNIFVEYRFLILVLSIISFILIIPLIQNEKFLMDSDQYTQYNIFYHEWNNLLENFLNGNGLPMYSWNSFLGSDFYSSKAYYVVGDIFIPIIYFCDKVLNNLDLGLIIKTILCFYISGITFNMFLKEYGVKSLFVRNIFALVYALSGSATLFIGQYMFYAFYSLFPLIFYGVERYFRTNNATTFIIIISVVYLQCYYMMFTATLFLGLYIGIRLYENKSNIIVDGLKLLFYYFIGVFISGILLVPAIYTIILNPRVGDSNITNIFFPTIINVRYIIDFIVLNSSNYLTSNAYTLDGFLLYISFIPLVSALSLIFKKGNRHYLIIIIVMLLGMIFMPISSLYHAFSEPTSRWLYIVVFFMIYFGAKGVDENINIKKASIIYLTLYVAASLYVGFNGFYQTLIIALLVSVIAWILFNYNRKYGLIFTVIVMSFSFTSKFYFKNDSFQWFTIERNIFLESNLDYYQSIDDDLIYRYNFDKSLDLDFSHNLNYSLKYGFMGLETYDSLFDSNIMAFLELNGVENHLIDLKDANVMNMLGVKYYIVLDEKDLPVELSFNYVYNIEHFLVYENLDYKGFGYSNDSVKYLHDLSDLSEFNNTTFIDDESIDINLYQDVSASSFDIYERGNNHLKGYIYSETNNILMLPIPNNSGWKVINNYEEVETISVNGGFIGVPLTSGDNNIEMYFVSNGFDLGLIFSAIGVITLIVYNIRRKR